MSYEFLDRHEFDQHIEDVRRLRFPSPLDSSGPVEEIIFVKLTGSTTAGCSVADAYYLNGTPAWIGTGRQVLVLKTDLTAPTSPTTVVYRAKYVGMRSDGSQFWGTYVIIDGPTSVPRLSCLPWTAPCSPFNVTDNAKITVASWMYFDTTDPFTLVTTRHTIYNRTQSYITPFGSNAALGGGPYVAWEGSPYDGTKVFVDTFTFTDTSGNRSDTYTADIQLAIYSCLENTVTVGYQARVRNYQPYTFGGPYTPADLITNWPKGPSPPNFSTENMGDSFDNYVYTPSIVCNGDGSWTLTNTFPNTYTAPGGLPLPYDNSAKAYITDTSGLTSYTYTAYNAVTVTIESQ